MNKMFCLVSIYLVMTSAFAAGDKELYRTAKMAERSTRTAPKIEATCSPYACSEVLRKSFKDIYRKGTAGTVNAVISDGSLKNPRTVCSSSAIPVIKASLAGLNRQLSTHFPHNDHGMATCPGTSDKLIPSEFRKSDGNLGTLYMAYDYNFKSEAIKSAMNDLLDAHTQINHLLPGSKVNCPGITDPKMRKRCQQLAACKTQGEASQNLEMKVSEVTLALKGIAKIKELQKSASRDQSKILKQDMEMIKDLNPLLKGEKFKKLIGTSPTKIQIQEALKGQLKISQAEISKKLQDFNSAYKCLNGMSQQCSKFDEIMKLSKYRQSGTIYPQARELNAISNFHQCVENIKEAREDADKVLNDAGINLALTLTPYAIVNGVKLTATLARTASISSKVTRGALAANLAYGGQYSLEEFKFCEKEVKEFQKLGSGKWELSCHNSNRILVNNSNNSRCMTQALISAALMTPMASESLRLGRNLSKTILPKADIESLANKIRQGQSLTPEQERLLLNQLKKKNPFDKILVKNLSPQDKLFASQTLDKLFVKQDVSPEDLLKLSKLIKKREPPLLIITNQDNVDDIMKSRTIWGNTEGSVYATTRPIETKVDRLKSGVHQEKEGTFIFTPEAAALFKPHEITGLYSAFKKSAGQYKGPFGDIVIEEAKKTIVNGRPHIVITKARRAGAAGEKLHSGQSTLKAAGRLAGRRTVLDPLATGTGAIVTIQAASVFTGVSVSDILFELLADKKNP